jgi:hypothetical protein
MENRNDAMHDSSSSLGNANIIRIYQKVGMIHAGRHIRRRRRAAAAAAGGGGGGGGGGSSFQQKRSLFFVSVAKKAANHSATFKQRIVQLKAL